ncbi:MAG: 4Fe-4S binding protein [Myxococcota bacterium]|jgi:Pyruvate/2-oxoacid:ferredoxin oxidoreductase delta subunit|nr:4Fe-4S binding protein [Myxococcota bacterium]
MRRPIIEIDERLCNGCGECVTACAEGAIQLVDGIARVVKEEYCDGLGACLGECPTGALQIREREAPAFDEAAAQEHVRRLRGEAAPTAHHPPAPAAHQPPAPAPAPAAPSGGCPGSRATTLRSAAPAPQAIQGTGLPARLNPSDLGQWPVQLHLVPTRAPFFADRELLVLSTCAPVASADVHWRFLRGRSVVVACPKLDVTDPYVEKLAAILRDNRIPRVVVLRMQVPCCGGLTRLVALAVRASGRPDLIVEEVVVGFEGEVVGQRELPLGE